MEAQPFFHRTVKAAVVAAGLLLAPGCSDGCVTNVVSRSDSPDGRHSVVMFQRDCGATTGFSTQISVLAPNEQPSDGGNIYRADRNSSATVAGSWGGPWAEARWTGNTTLLIRYAAGSRIFEQRPDVSGIAVTYEAVSR